MQRFIPALALVLLSAPAAFPEDARPDKTTHKVGLPIPAYLAVIPATANNPGRQGAYYKTRVVMHNVTNHDFRVSAMLYSSSGIRARESIPMTAGSYRVWDNFLQEVFNFRGGGAVALIAESALPQVEDPDDITDQFSITAEVYTDSENGRFTTTVVNGLLPLILGEPIAVSAGVTVDQNQRVNLGVFNLDQEEPAAVLVALPQEPPEPKPAPAAAQAGRFQIIDTGRGRLFLLDQRTGDTWKWFQVKDRGSGWQYFDRPTRIEGCTMGHEGAALPGETCLQEPIARARARRFTFH